MKTLLPIISSTVLLGLLAGCASSTGLKQAGNTSTSLQQTAEGIDDALTPLDAVLAALTDLMNNPGSDIAPQFQQYSSALSTLESLTKSVSGHANAMQQDGIDYFRKWDEQLATIENDGIRTRSLDRKIAVAARFEEVRANYVQTTAEFDPFMSDLKDIRTALATDLTAGGLRSIEGLASKANRIGRPLRDSLVALSRECKVLGAALSSANPVT
jgi:hypothetical protein